MIADIKLTVTTHWVDSESLFIVYNAGKLDATEGRKRSFVTGRQDEAEAYRQGYQEGMSIVAMLTGGDIDILPDTLWADETSQDLPADLDFNAMLDTMRVEQVLTPEQSASYNWGWLCWIVGTSADKLSGWSLHGWQDADEQYGQERRAEREMFAQTVGCPLGANWVAE